MYINLRGAAQGNDPAAMLQRQDGDCLSFVVSSSNQHWLLFEMRPLSVLLANVLLIYFSRRLMAAIWVLFAVLALNELKPLVLHSESVVMTRTRTGKCLHYLGAFGF
jgi:hypothetical protein